MLLLVLTSKLVFYVLLATLFLEIDLYVLLLDGVGYSITTLDCDPWLFLITPHALVLYWDADFTKLSSLALYSSSETNIIFT